MNSQASTLALPLTAHLNQFPLLERWFFSMLTRVHIGQLDIFFEGKHYQCGDVGSAFRASIRLHHPLKLARKFIMRGDLGFAESYIAGDWETDNLGQLLTLLLRNFDNIGKSVEGNRLMMLWSKLLHRFRKNSLKGSKKNIAYHYDMGNDFYEEWLDKSMTYSSALYQEGDDLYTAQQRKYQRILDELDTDNQSAQILEIGCGWGGFAENALKAGHSLHGITLSQEQCNYAKQRLQHFGENANIEIRDYRKLDQQYDHIVSIEMFEAVGQDYWESYFDVLQKSLKPGGKAVLQIITIKDESFEAYSRNVDFIQRYIFPGGLLPSIQKLNEQIDQTDLTLVNTHSFGKDYAETLRTWDKRFIEALPNLRKLGYDKNFENMWRYYLAYCEAGFNEGEIDVVQLTLQKQ